MTVLVDTCVRADYLNGFPSREADALAILIEDEVEIVTRGLVLAEFLQGIRDARSLKRLESFFRDMDLMTPSEPDTYLGAARLYSRLRGRGVFVGSTIGCLIAKLAEEAGVLLLARDRDIKLIIGSELCQVRSVRL